MLAIHNVINIAWVFFGSLNAWLGNNCLCLEHEPNQPETAEFMCNKQLMRQDLLYRTQLNANCGLAISICCAVTTVYKRIAASWCKIDDIKVWDMPIVSMPPIVGKSVPISLNINISYIFAFLLPMSTTESYDFSEIITLPTYFIASFWPISTGK